MASAAGSRGLSGASSRLASSLRNIGTAAHNDDPTLSSTESFTDINSSDDEEIVWSISDLSVVSVPHTSSDDEDYVLLGRADSPIAVHSIPSGVTSLSASVLESRAGLSSADGLSDVFSRLQVEADDSDSESEVRPASQATTRRRTRSRPRRSASSTVKKASAQAPPATPARAPAARAAPTNVQASQDAVKAAANKARLAARKAAEAQGLSKVEVKKAGKKAAKKARKAALSSSVSSSSASTSSQTATSSSVESSPAQSTRSVSFYQDAVEYISAYVHTLRNESVLRLAHALICSWLIQIPVYAVAQTEEQFRPYVPPSSHHRARSLPRHGCRGAVCVGDVLRQSAESSPLASRREGPA